MPWWLPTAAQSHLLAVHTHLGVAQGDPLAAALPLFPDHDGATVMKQAVVESIEQVATRLGEPLQDALGARRFGGHSLRVSGAQWLARLGFEVEHIKTFGRWTSDTVLRYLAEAHVEDLSKVRLRTMRERSLLGGYQLEVPAPSGPQLCTSIEVDRIIAEAMNVQMFEVHQRLNELQSHSSTRYELVLAVARNFVHSLASDLSSAPDTWQTRCGWRFAGAPGFRLAKSCNFAVAAPWKQCSKCWPPIAAGV
jgi:hypothetical protein